VQEELGTILNYLNSLWIVGFQPGTGLLWVCLQAITFNFPVAETGFKMKRAYDKFKLLQRSFSNLMRKT